MPIPPSPMRYRCVQCGWSTITRPKSDCLLPGDIIHRCPQCGSKNLKTTEKTSVLRFFQKITKKNNKGIDKS